MGQPSSSCAPSYALNSTLRPRVVQQIHPKVHLADEEATCMPVRIASFLTLGNRRRLLLFGALLPSAGDKACGRLSALLSHSGRGVLLLDIAIPVSSVNGEESITLPSTVSGVTRASVQLPRQGVDVRLTGGLLSEKSESAAESKWIAYGRGNEAITFAWRRKTEDHRATLPLRMRGSLTQLLGLGEDSTSINAEISLEVTQGAARVARIQIPDKVTINQVLGAMVADWEVKANELSVTFP